MEDDSKELFISLYIDEDVTSALAQALRWRGYRAISTFEAGNIGASDEAQLEYATEHGMAILTYNSKDFVPLARTWFLEGRNHAGIIISHQFDSRQFGELLRRVLRLIDAMTADEIKNRIVFLQQFQ